MVGRRLSHDIRLLDALSQLSETSFDGVFWRVVHGTRSPLDGSKGAGRWNRRESEVLYCALERDGALSEISFHMSRQQSVFPSRIRSALHRMQAQFEKVLDLTNPSVLNNLDVDLQRYQEILYVQTQRVGEAVGFLGFEAMLVPNARHPSTNLVIFPANCNLDAISHLEVTDVNWAEWRQKRRTTGRLDERN